MAERIVVGAGLSGLTAAICLRRQGHEVRVLERRDGVGGPARDLPTGDLTYMMADGTPIQLERLSRYIGFDLAPACLPLRRIRVNSFGKYYEVEFPPNLPTWLVERGPRPTSLDQYLYRMALGMGIRFEFNHAIRTKKDLDQLPPRTILATGLSKDVFQALGIPYLPSYGFLAQGPRFVLEAFPLVIVYMDRHSWDYGFFSHVNGIGGALLFQRKKPLSPEAKMWFVETLAREGIEFSHWWDVDLAGIPAASLKNPRLFHGRFILAGTLSGAMDPLLLFGVHGALVTGRVAAQAVDDPERAIREFRRINLFWRWSFLNRSLVEATHPWGMKLASRMILELYPLYAPLTLRYLFLTVPGWLRI